MNDCFALLNQPRRPWLDLELLKARFLELSSQFHPDRFHNAGDAEKRTAQDRYSELNAAYGRLRDPKERLVHLLELELGARPTDIQTIPPALINFFSEVNQACRKADAVIQDKSSVTSPLLKVKTFDHGQQCAESLGELLRKINSEREIILDQIRMVDADWEKKAERNEAIRRLEQNYRLLSFYTRWAGQLQERIVQLML
jgi:curved DNA-binding protein CbpA